MESLPTSVYRGSDSEKIEESSPKDFSENKAVVDPTERMLRMIDYSRCYFVANNYSNSPSQRDLMCSKLESDLGGILRGTCYRLSNGDYNHKKGFCFNFNH